MHIQSLFLFFSWLKRIQEFSLPLELLFLQRDLPFIHNFIILFTPHEFIVNVIEAILVQFFEVGTELSLLNCICELEREPGKEG
jgi:hypothetical protein